VAEFWQNFIYSYVSVPKQNSARILPEFCQILTKITFLTYLGRTWQIMGASWCTLLSDRCQLHHLISAPEACQMCNIGPCPIPNSQDCPAKSIQIPHIQHFVHTPNPYRPSTHPIHAPSTVPTPIQPAPMYAQLAQPTHLPIPSLGPYAQPSHPAQSLYVPTHTPTSDWPCT